MFHFLVMPSNEKIKSFSVFLAAVTPQQNDLRSASDIQCQRALNTAGAAYSPTPGFTLQETSTGRQGNRKLEEEDGKHEALKTWTHSEKTKVRRHRVLHLMGARAPQTPPARRARARHAEKTPQEAAELNVTSQSARI